MGKVKYSPEMKEQTVKYVLEGNKSATKVAKELGIDTNTVCRWVREYREAHLMPTYEVERKIKNKAIPIYNKYYKRYAARVKVRQIKEPDFKKWKYKAMKMRDQCSDGTISVEEFTEWMESSFPNRKPKE